MINSPSPETAVALGSFDGLHIGHKSVIACALSFKERGLIPCALLFNSHPLSVLTGSAPPALLQRTVRSRMLADMGIKEKFAAFEEVMNMSPREFFDEILIGRLSAGAVCCGANFHFGKNGEGNTDTLAALCREKGIEIVTVPLVYCGGSPVSSSRIREAIKNGDIPAANEMLGYEFCYEAIVRTGSKRGRQMGFPTINQYFEDDFIVPKTGVYASRVTVDGKEYPGVTNIGLRPSFENEDLRSETCILNFSGDLYGETIKVSLIERIRDERLFADMDELRSQIKKDAEQSLILGGCRHV